MAWGQRAALLRARLRRPCAAAVAALLLVVAAAVTPAAAARTEAKGARIQVQAKWQGTPYLHEAAEFLADEDPSLFWRFIEEWQARLPALGTSPDQCWAGIRGAAAQHLSPTMAALFDVSLAARQYSPRLEAFRQLAAESSAELAAAAGAAKPCCWALLGGRAYTDGATLAHAVAAALGAEAHAVAGGTGAVYPFDHVYASPAAASAPPLNITAPGTIPVELFAPVGSRCGAELHAVLAAAAAQSDAAAAAAAAAGAAQSPRLAYAWRPALDSDACGSAVHACTQLGTDGRLVVPGYGVELALKNMEYNAQDDKKEGGDKKQEGGEEEGGELAASEEGEGDGEEEEDYNDAGVLEVKLKNLGLQAAQRILKAAGAVAGGDALGTLQEVAQNFPRLVRQLSQHKYGKSLRKAVEALQRYIPPGAQFFLVNGVMVDTRDFSLFTFLDALRREIRLYDALSAVGLAPAQVREAQMLRGAAAGADEPPRLRLPLGDGIAWVNDLERDDKYEGWPADLNALLRPTFPGRLPAVRRNVLTGVFLFDPASPAALDIGALARQAANQMWPLRVGLAPVVPARAAQRRGGAGPKSADPPSVSERMGRLLSLISRTFSPAEAAEFMFVLRGVMQPAEDGAPDFAQRLWETAERELEEQWEGWGGGEGGTWTAEQVLEQVTAPGDGTSVNLDPLALKFLDASAELAANSGLAGLSGAGVLVLNGAVTTSDGGSGGWQGAAGQALHAAMQGVQEDVYMQRLSNAAVDLHEEILQLHGSISRYNPRIMPLDSGSGFSRISGETEEFATRQLALTGPLLGLNATAPHPGTPAGTGLWARYFGPEPSLLDEDEGEGAAPLAAVTHWVVADVTTRQGLRLVSAAVQHRSSEGRVAVLVNTAGELAPVERFLVAVSSGLFDADRNDLAEQLDALLQRPEAPAQLTVEQLDEAIQFGGYLASALDGLAGKLPAAATSQAALIRGGLRLGPGVSAVVSNGRVVELPGPVAAAAADGADGRAEHAVEGADLEPGDFGLLELYAQRSQYSRQVAELVRQAVQFGALPSADASAVAAAVSSALAAYQPDEADPRSGRLVDLISSLSGQKNFLRVAAPASAGSASNDGVGAATPPLLLQAVLNPLSKPAQRLAPLLRFLRDALGAEVQLLLNPQTEYEDMPLKTFYRYVLPALPAPGQPGPPPAAAADFTRLPPTKVLTLGMDEPEAWLVEPVRAEHDLDNLRLEELGPGAPRMEATYELEALLLTGMCLDLASLHARMREQIHPRGVQLQLLPASAPPSSPPLVDTLVMSNLGYFQLKSRPGLWKLKLAPGRSQELYTVASSTGASSSGHKAEAAVAGADAHSVPVALTSFTGKHMHLFLRKHAHRLHEDVLDAEGSGGDAHGDGSLWQKVASWAGGKGGAPAAEGDAGNVLDGAVAEDGRIHVFTVASGHMYERLQKIMVLSATKRTSARLKFWFIKNYMSPQMKAFVPFMARKYDFDYEFVTYKWPSWLHKQTEKQRIIWAYKILFLDVLFPLNLKKVIFCDSDQVVRADLAELWTMDLQGAPYGYTPFCDNNRDMEGFRFWKQGFWKDHLQGKPYHISALYVVDLERFRQMAAGDRLRVIYDGLSKDPNSLANLDQDLPNYAQHGVPIFSLPQEWLWCETWCGNETRLQAKTIDLCNNPLTKEPKLQSARRIIAEWPDLNREAQEFTAAVEAVQRGERSEEQLMADRAAFHVRLTPMVEGSTWTSEQGGADAQAEAAGAAGAAADAADGAGAGHDATEL